MGIGKKLEYLLEENEMHVSELSRKLGVTSSSIYSMITRDSKKADITLLLKISDIFGVDVSYFGDDYTHDDIITIQFSTSDFTEEQLKRIQAFAKFIKKEGF